MSYKNLYTAYSNANLLCARGIFTIAVISIFELAKKMCKQQIKYKHTFCTINYSHCWVCEALELFFFQIPKKEIRIIIREIQYLNRRIGFLHSARRQDGCAIEIRTKKKQLSEARRKGKPMRLAQLKLWHSTEYINFNAHSFHVTVKLRLLLVLPLSLTLFLFAYLSLLPSSLHIVLSSVPRDKVTTGTTDWVNSNSKKK